MQIHWTLLSYSSLQEKKFHGPMKYEVSFQTGNIFLQPYHIQYLWNIISKNHISPFVIMQPSKLLCTCAWHLLKDTDLNMLKSKILIENPY